MAPGFKEVVIAAPLIVFFIICAGLALKLVPPYLAQKKELGLADIELRKEALRVHLVGSEAIGKLTETLRSQTDSTDELRLFLRVAMREHDAVREAQIRIDRRIEEVGRGTQPLR